MQALRYLTMNSALEPNRLPVSKIVLLLIPDEQVSRGKHLHGSWISPLIQMPQSFLHGGSQHDLKSCFYFSDQILRQMGLEWVSLRARTQMLLHHTAARAHSSSSDLLLSRQSLISVPSCKLPGCSKLKVLPALERYGGSSGWLFSMPDRYGGGGSGSWR